MFSFSTLEEKKKKKEEKGNNKSERKRERKREIGLPLNEIVSSLLLFVCFSMESSSPLFHCWRLVDAIKSAGRQPARTRTGSSPIEIGSNDFVSRLRQIDLSLGQLKFPAGGRDNGRRRGVGRRGSRGEKVG